MCDYTILIMLKVKVNTHTNTCIYKIIHTYLFEKISKVSQNWVKILTTSRYKAVWDKCTANTSKSGSWKIFN